MTVAQGVQTGLTLVIAVIATYIAYQQWKTNADKLELDLFEKRFRVFETVRKVVATVISQGDASSIVVSEFRIGCADAEFLFGDDLKTYLDEIYERASRLRLAVFHSGNVIDAGPERDEIVKGMTVQMDWFREQPEKLPAIFKKYLDVSKL